MSTQTDSVVESTAEELVISRVFDAPRDLVFKAWTEPEHLMRWWRPIGFTTLSFTSDLRAGGVFHYCWRSSEPRDYCGMGVYREIVAPERIVYTDAFADADGNRVPPSHYGMSDAFPEESLVTVTFSEQQGRTKVTLRHSVSDEIEERKDMEEGWSQMFGRLAEEVAPARMRKAS